MPAGFFIFGWKPAEPCDRAGPTIGSRGNECCGWGFFPERGSHMPPWMEILINVIGYAGFIAVATCHKSSGDQLPDR
jgi:hypothetical protein